MALRREPDVCDRKPCVSTHPYGIAHDRYSKQVAAVHAAFLQVLAEKQDMQSSLRRKYSEYLTGKSTRLQLILSYRGAVLGACIRDENFRAYHQDQSIGKATSLGTSRF